MEIIRFEWTIKRLLQTKVNFGISIRNFFNTLDNSILGLWVFIYSFCIIIFTLFFAILFDKHLSADGAHYFVEILQTHTFTYIDWTRQFANYISQTLLVLGVILGIKDIEFLIKLFGISLLIPYILTFLLSLFALRGEDKSPIFFMLISMITINLTSDFLLVGEGHLVALLSWPILFFLLRKKSLINWDIFFLFSLMVLYTRLYSAAVIPASFFMFIAFFRILNTSLISQKIYYFIAMLLAMIAEAISIYSILYPRSIENKEAFTTIILQSLYTPEVITSIFFLIFFFLGWFFRKQVLVWITFIPILFFILYVMCTDYSISVSTSFGNRSLVLSLLPLLLLMTILSYWKEKKMDITLYAIFIGFVLVMSFTNILNTIQWNKYRHKTINILQTQSGFIPIEETFIRDSKYIWSWTNSELSVIWSKGCVKTIILNENKIGWEPYNPLHNKILTSYVCYSISDYYDNIFTKKIPFNSTDVIFRGWSYPERTHRWSLGKKSKIFFNIKNIEQSKGLVRLNFGTLGKQQIKIFINGKNIANGIFHGNTNIIFNFNPNILKDDSFNIIEFKFTNAHKPNNSDSRVLAMALKYLMIE